jgi:hypothetical protein
MDEVTLLWGIGNPKMKTWQSVLAHGELDNLIAGERICREMGQTKKADMLAREIRQRRKKSGQ